MDYILEIGKKDREIMTGFISYVLYSVNQYKHRIELTFRAASLLPGGALGQMVVSTLIA